MMCRDRSDPLGQLDQRGHAVQRVQPELWVRLDPQGRWVRQDRRARLEPLDRSVRLVLQGRLEPRAPQVPLVQRGRLDPQDQQGRKARRVRAA